MKKLFTVFILAFTAAQLTAATFTAFQPATSGTSTLNIKQASFWGSVKWDTTTNCQWSTTGTSFSNYGTDADCDNSARTIKGVYNSTNGDVGNADGQLPQIKFSQIPAGTLRCEAKGFFYSGAPAQYSFRFNDGANSTAVSTTYTAGSSGDLAITNLHIGEFQYDSDQGATTITLQTALTTSTGYIELNSNNEEFEISCYHYPSEHQVFATSCSGLECENEFSAKITHTSGSTVVDSENVDWISSCSTADEPVCTFTSGLFGSTPSCQLTVQGGSTTKFSSGIKTLSSSSITLQAAQNSFTAFSGSSTYTSYQLKCQRQGSDFNPMDKRFIPISDNETETFWNNRASNFWDATGDTDEWDHSLVTPAFSTSQYITVTDVSGQTRITNVHDGPVIMDVHVSAESGGAAEVIIYRSDGNFSAYTDNKTANQDMMTSATYKVDANDYIYIRNTSTPASRVGSISISVRPSNQKAFIGNLTPKEFVQTPGSTKPVMYSARILTTGTVDKEVSSWINGNCTNANPQVCTLETGKFSSAPSCVVSSTNQNYHCAVYDESTTGFTIDCLDYNGAGSPVDINKTVICHGTQ